MIKKWLIILSFCTAIVAYEHTVKNTLKDPILVHIGVEGGVDSWHYIKADETNTVKTWGLDCSDMIEIYVLDGNIKEEAQKTTKDLSDIKLEIKAGKLALIKTGDALYIDQGTRGRSFYSFSFHNTLSNALIIHQLPHNIIHVNPFAKITIKEPGDVHLTVYVLKNSAITKKNHAKKEIPLLKQCRDNTYKIDYDKNKNLLIALHD